MKRRLMLALTFVLVCVLILPMVASCDLGGKKVWFCREDGDIEYYISFDEKAEEILVVVVDGRDAESFTFDYEIDDDEIEIKDTAKNKVVFSYKEKSESYISIDGVKFKITDEEPDDYEEGDREFTVYELLGKLGESVLSGTYTAEDKDDGQTATITFNADGSLSIIKTSMNGSAKIETGTYEIKEDKIKVTVEGETEEYEYSFESGELVIDGVKFKPSKNQSTTVKPADTFTPNYDENQPSYTVPNHDDAEASENKDPSGALTEPKVDTDLPPEQNIGDVMGTYETFDEDGDGINYIFVFDFDSYTIYEVVGKRVQQIEKGTYKIKENTVYLKNGSVDIDYYRGFIYNGQMFYKTAPHPEHPDQTNTPATAMPPSSVAVGSGVDKMEFDTPINDTMVFETEQNFGREEP